MKRRLLYALAAIISAAMFGIMYPEYILLPDTYDYIEEGSKASETIKKDLEKDLTELLYAKPEQVRVSSRILQYLAEEGKVIWKNKS